MALECFYEYISLTPIKAGTIENFFFLCYAFLSSYKDIFLVGTDTDRRKIIMYEFSESKIDKETRREIQIDVEQEDMKICNVDAWNFRMGEGDDLLISLCNDSKTVYEHYVVFHEKKGEKLVVVKEHYLGKTVSPVVVFPYSQKGILLILMQIEAGNREEMTNSYLYYDFNEKSFATFKDPVADFGKVSSKNSCLFVDIDGNGVSDLVIPLSGDTQIEVWKNTLEGFKKILVHTSSNSLKFSNLTVAYLNKKSRKASFLYITENEKSVFYINIVYLAENSKGPVSVEKKVEFNMNDIIPKGQKVHQSSEEDFPLIKEVYLSFIRDKELCVITFDKTTETYYIGILVLTMDAAEKMLIKYQVVLGSKSSEIIGYSHFTDERNMSYFMINRQKDGVCMIEIHEHQMKKHHVFVQVYVCVSRNKKAIATSIPGVMIEVKGKMLFYNYQKGYVSSSGGKNMPFTIVPFGTIMSFLDSMSVILPIYKSRHRDSAYTMHSNTKLVPENIMMLGHYNLASNEYFLTIYLPRFSSIQIYLILCISGIILAGLVVLWIMRHIEQKKNKNIRKSIRLPYIR